MARHKSYMIKQFTTAYFRMQYSKTQVTMRKRDCKWYCGKGR